MYQYTKAPNFTSGSSLSAKNISKLCDAFNDRLKYGVGDCSRRVHQGIMNSMRNWRNPDDTLFPSQMESLTFYNHIPNDTDDLYFDAGRGEPQGANLANPVSAFVFGNPQLFGEGDRLSTLIELIPDTTIKNKWDLAKVQRGGYDSASLLAYQPFNSASQEHFRIGAYPFQFYLKSPGGFLPTPLILGICTDSETDPTIVFPNQQIKFTKLSDSSVITYTGTCGPAYGGTDTDVATVIEFPFEWRVYIYNGDIDIYPKSEYIQGPYEGSGQLAKDNFDFLNRNMLNSYVKEFKGWDTYQIEHISASTSPYPLKQFGCYDILSSSFNFENVINRPWQLSPAYAVKVGDDLDIRGYPSTSLSTNQTSTPDNSVLFPNPYKIHEHYVMGGFYASATDLSQSVKIQTLADGKIINEFTLETGSLGNPHFFDMCDTTKTKITGSIQFALISDLIFSGSNGSVYIEISELWEAYPQIYDLYTYLRMATTLGGDISIETTNDQMAPDEDQADVAFLNYDTYGACINLNGAAGVDQPEDVINTNPPYDSLRRQIRGMARYIKKEYLSGYSIEDGKSVLYFDKYLDVENTINMWDGLLNPFNSSSNGIITGSNSSGSIWTNNWIMDVGLKPTNPSDSSIFKDDNFYWWGTNRALFLNSLIPSLYPDIYNFLVDGGSNFISPGNLQLLTPEYGITYLNYIRNVNDVPENDDETDTKFFKSCQIYEEPLYIESITQTNYNEVRIQFNKRMQHTDEADSVINRDTGSWNPTTLAAEPYRTLENSIRDYLIIGSDLDNNSIPVRIGDHANRSIYGILTDAPNGMVPETFCFLKCISKPITGSVNTSGCCDKNDTNGVTLSAETLIQMEYYLKSFCEGFVDSTTPFVCDTFNDTTAYDYTYNNLMFQATNHSSSNLPFPLRTDNGTNYGSLPTFFCYAKTLQQLSNAINLLVDARLPLEFSILTKTCNYYGSGAYSPNIVINGEGNCAGSFTSGVITSTSGPPANVLLSCDEEWQELTAGPSGDYVFGAGTQTGLNADGNCTEDGEGWLLASSRQAIQYKFSLINPLSYNCISSELYDNIVNGSHNGFFGLFEDFQQTIQAYQVGTQAEAASGCESSTMFWNSSTGIGYNYNLTTIDNFSCRLFKDGIIDLGPNAPASSIFLCRNRGVDPDSFGGGGGVHSQAIRVMSLDTLVVNIPLIE